MKHAIAIALLALISACQGVDVNGIHLEFDFEPTLAEEANAIRFVGDVADEMGGDYAGAIVILYDNYDAIGERYAAERLMTEQPCIGGYHAGDLSRLATNVIHAVPEALAHELVHHEISHTDGHRKSISKIGQDNDQMLDRQDHVHSPAAGWFPADDKRIDDVNEKLENVLPWESAFCADGYTTRS